MNNLVCPGRRAGFIPSRSSATMAKVTNCGPLEQTAGGRCGGGLLLPDPADADLHQADAATAGRDARELNRLDIKNRVAHAGRVREQDPAGLDEPGRA